MRNQFVNSSLDYFALWLKLCSHSGLVLSYLGVSLVKISDEGKSPGPAGVPLGGQVDVPNVAVLVKQRL